MLAIEPLQVSLGAEPDAVRRPAGRAGGHRLIEQAVAQTAPLDWGEVTTRPMAAPLSSPMPGAMMRASGQPKIDRLHNRAGAAHRYRRSTRPESLEGATLLHHQHLRPAGASSSYNSSVVSCGPRIHTPVHRMTPVLIGSAQRNLAPRRGALSLWLSSPFSSNADIGRQKVNLCPGSSVIPSGSTLIARFQPFANAAQADGLMPR